MNWIDDAWRHEELPRPVVATIGNYDGVHRGQRSILDALTQCKTRLGVPAAVVTFAPHPLRIVAPERAPRRLASSRQKAELLAAAGVDHVLEVRFDEAFSRMAADRFVRQFLVDRLAVRALFVGSRFVFGRDQEGDLALLQRLGGELGFEAHGVPEVMFDEAPISSSRIRRAVAAGEIDAAAHMLGRAFAMRGTIVHGERRGRGLGWPTINLMPDKDQVIPDRGVYVASVRLGGESRARPAVTNVGVRPTVSAGKDLLVESHILDFSADVYGMEAEVAFLRRLRAERAFESVEALSTQINHDVEQARQYFASAQQDRSSERTEETFDGK